MEPQECRYCKFYKCALPRLDEQMGWGWCRRHAPTTVMDDNAWSWPAVDSDDWCGEFEENQNWQE